MSKAEGTECQVAILSRLNESSSQRDQIKKLISQHPQLSEKISLDLADNFRGAYLDLLEQVLKGNKLPRAYRLSDSLTLEQREKIIQPLRKTLDLVKTDDPRFHIQTLFLTRSIGNRSFTKKEFIDLQKDVEEQMIQATSEAIKAQSELQNHSDYQLAHNLIPKALVQSGKIKSFSEMQFLVSGAAFYNRKITEAGLAANRGRYSEHWLHAAPHSCREYLRMHAVLGMVESGDFSKQQVEKSVAVPRQEIKEINLKILEQLNLRVDTYLQGKGKPKMEVPVVKEKLMELDLSPLNQIVAEQNERLEALRVKQAEITAQAKLGKAYRLPLFEN